MWTRGEPALSERLMPSQFLGFVAVAAVFCLTPGPDTVLVVNRALGLGRRHALLTATGSACGLVAWGALASVGVAAIFETSATAFTTLKLVGSGYLVLLGIQALLRAHRDAAAASADAHPAERTHPSAFRQGLLTNLLNPKAGVFFVAVMPQFIAGDDNVLMGTLLLAVLDAILSLTALSLYTMVALTSQRLLRRQVARRAMDRVSGAVLIGLGVRLAAEAR